MFIGLQSADAT